MITVRQIERHWEAKSYGRLFAELVAARPEAQLHLGIDAARAIPAAALGIIRLDELSQSGVNLYSKLVRTLLAAQDADGGWQDPVTTALCARALMCGEGNGLAIDRAMKYLANLQKSEGTWPNIPIRRMPADPYVSALILYQLGDKRQFRLAVRLADAVNWFNQNTGRLDAETRQLWERARTRCRFRTAEPEQAPCMS